jgi:hypothetical protein
LGSLVDGDAATELRLERRIVVGKHSGLHR